MENWDCQGNTGASPLGLQDQWDSTRVLNAGAVEFIQLMGKRESGLRPGSAQQQIPHRAVIPQVGAAGEGPLPAAFQPGMGAAGYAKLKPLVCETHQ